jgi:plasmid stabilization system protein ParE
MTKNVVWSRRAEIDMTEIKAFYDKRNKSTAYSDKLLKAFQNTADLIEKYPHLGRLSSYDRVRGVVVSNFILFYEILEKHVLILTVWDCRQNPEQLEEILG